MSRHSLPPHRMLTLFAFLLILACPVAATADARLSEGYGKLPLHFEANQGQTHEDVRFLSRGPGYSLYLTAGEAVVVLAKPSPDEKGKRSAQASPGAKAQPESVALRMSLIGARSKPAVSGHEELPGKANYFVGNDPEKWRTNVPTYAKVHYREVYPGIDLVYYGNQRQLEYDFIVAPGADPKKIVLGFKGADRLEIDAEGDLVLHAPGGVIRQKKPVIYQEVDGVRQKVAGSYVRKGSKRVGFKVAAYDTSRPLIIDPVVLSYFTYLGGSDFDGGERIAVDAEGSAYLAGVTASTNFPTAPGSFQPIINNTQDAFVTKLNPAGSALVYSTYLGGSGVDSGRGIAVDTTGNAYVTGVTNSADFPISAGAFQLSLGSSGNVLDAFVTKLDPTGSTLVYSSYLGGMSHDLGKGIAVDADGNAYVTGYTNSTNFPTTVGAFQSFYGGQDPEGNIPFGDAFVTKVNPTGSSLVYSTFLGGINGEEGLAIAVDSTGHAYVTGHTYSVNFPTTVGAFQPIIDVTGKIPNNNTFVSKLHPTGSLLVYSTYLGGTGAEEGRGIAVDAEGNAYVTGITTSANFPITPGAYQSTMNSFHEAFVTKLNPVGSALVYSTYLGGSDIDQGNGIAVDTAGNAYVTGYTFSINFPTTVGAFQPTFASSSGRDAFVTKLNPAGTGLIYSTYLGGSTDDLGFGIAVDASGNAYVTGYTTSSNLPTTPGAVQTTFGGIFDAFVAKFVDLAPPPPPAAP